MKVKEIVTRVRAAIDELMVNDSGFLSQSSDEANLTNTIIDKIPYALIYIIENAPIDKLDTVKLDALPASAWSLTGLVGMVELDDDVLRVVSARFTSWKLSPLPVSEHSQEYLMQQDEYAHGSWDRPVTVLVHHGAKRYLELYSAKSSSDAIEVSVIKKPSTSDLGAVDASNYESSSADVSVPTALEAAFIYQIAGLTMVAFRESVAPSLFSIAKEYMGYASESNQ